MTILSSSLLWITGLSNIAFHLQLLWLQTLVAINSESCQRLFPSFCSQPSEVNTLKPLLVAGFVGSRLLLWQLPPTLWIHTLACDSWKWAQSMTDKKFDWTWDIEYPLFTEAVDWEWLPDDDLWWSALAAGTQTWTQTWPLQPDQHVVKVHVCAYQSVLPKLCPSAAQRAWPLIFQLKPSIVFWYFTVKPWSNSLFSLWKLLPGDLQPEGIKPSCRGLVCSEFQGLAVWSLNSF